MVAMSCSISLSFQEDAKPVLCLLCPGLQELLRLRLGNSLAVYDKRKKHGTDPSYACLLTINMLCRGGGKWSLAIQNGDVNISMMTLTF